MDLRSRSNSSNLSWGRKCGSHKRPVLTLLSLVFTTPPRFAAPALASTSRILYVALDPDDHACSQFGCHHHKGSLPNMFGSFF